MVDPTGQTGVGVWVARGIMTGIAADVVVPEPTDAVPWKWAAYGALTAVACIAACDEVGNAIGNILTSDNASDDAPGLPEGLVGEQDSRGGRTRGRTNSGPLAPEHGGTGDADEDFETLTGGAGEPAPEGAGYPEGTRVGDNGIQIRPGRPASC